MIEYHETLNPKLWINNKLIPEVKNKLIEIYQTFINKLKDLSMKDMNDRLFH